MAVLIDASILIEYERRRLDLERHLAQRREEAFFLSVVTASEPLHTQPMTVHDNAENLSSENRKWIQPIYVIVFTGLFVKIDSACFVSAHDLFREEFPILFI